MTNIRTGSGRAGSRSLPRLIAAALGCALLLALYLPTLDFPFYFDDRTDIVDNPSIRVTSLRPGAVLRATGETHNVALRRPIAFYTFALNYYAGGLDPSGYRLVNVLIHLANALLVWLLARRLATLALRRPAGEAFPLLAAALWALHPVQTNAVVYIVQRMTSLSTFFYLAAFLSYLRGRERRAPLWFALGAVLFALAVGSKEIAYTLPALILLAEAAFTPGVRRWLAKRRWVVPLALGAALLLFPLALALFGGEYATKPYTWQQRLLTEARVVAHYLSLLAAPLPSRLLFDYSGLPLSTGILSPATTLPAVLLHAALLALGGALLVRRPLAGFCILGFYLHLAIESTVIPIEIAYEHRLYLPSVFLFAGLGVLGGDPDAPAARTPSRSRLAAAVLVAAVVACSWWTRERLAIWRDPLAFWGDIAAKDPGNARAQGGMGQVSYERGNLAAARRHILRATELDPANGRNWMNLGLVEADSGNNETAVALLTKAFLRGFSDPLLFANLAEIQERLGKLPEAVVSLERALSYDSRLPEINFGIGRLSLAMGEIPKARAHLLRELALNPSHREAARLLGSIEGGSLGRPRPGN